MFVLVQDGTNEFLSIAKRFRLQRCQSVAFFGDKAVLKPVMLAIEQFRLCTPAVNAAWQVKGSAKFDMDKWQTPSLGSPCSPGQQLSFTASMIYGSAVSQAAGGARGLL